MWISSFVTIVDRWVTLLYCFHIILFLSSKCQTYFWLTKGQQTYVKIHIATFPFCMHQEETDLEFKFIVSNRQKSYLPLISAFISQEFSEVPPKAWVAISCHNIVTSKLYNKRGGYLNGSFKHSVLHELQGSSILNYVSSDMSKSGLVIQSKMEKRIFSLFFCRCTGLQQHGA